MNDSEFDTFERLESECQILKAENEALRKELCEIKQQLVGTVTNASARITALEAELTELKARRCDSCNKVMGCDGIIVLNNHGELCPENVDSCSLWEGKK